TIRSHIASDDILPGRGRWRTPRQAHPHAPGLILPAVLAALWWTLACRLYRRRMPDGTVTYTTPPSNGGHHGPEHTPGTSHMARLPRCRVPPSLRGSHRYHHRHRLPLRNPRPRLSRASREGPVP